MVLEIKFEGKDAHDLGLKVKKLFEEITVSDLDLREDGNTARPLAGDSLAIAAFILSIPGAIVATLTLIDRFKLMEKVGKMLEKVKTSKCSVTLVDSRGTQLDLNSAGPEEVVDRFR